MHERREMNLANLAKSVFTFLITLHGKQNLAWRWLEHEPKITLICLHNAEHSFRARGARFKRSQRDYRRVLWFHCFVTDASRCAFLTPYVVLASDLNNVWVSRNESGHKSGTRCLRRVRKENGNQSAVCQWFRQINWYKKPRERRKKVFSIRNEISELD